MTVHVIYKKELDKESWGVGGGQSYVDKGGLDRDWMGGIHQNKLGNVICLEVKSMSNESPLKISPKSKSASIGLSLNHSMDF